MKSLENKLRSWRPRRPSATLKWRLFLANAANVTRLVRFAGWMTPATACVLLGMLLLGSENVVPAGGSRLPSIMAMLSNQSYAVTMTSRQSQQNNLSVFSFDWTNGSNSGLTSRFMPLGKPTD